MTTKAAARKTFLRWLRTQTTHPTKFQVEKMACYDTTDVGRAIRELGAEKAVDILAAYTPNVSAQSRS